MVDIFCKGSLKVNNVCINNNREHNSSSFPKLVKQEEMMQQFDRSKEPTNKGSYRAPDIAPSTSLPMFMTTTTGPYRPPERGPFPSLPKSLDHHGTKETLASRTAPAAFRVKGRKRLHQEPSSDEDTEHTACVASSPEY